MLEDFYDNGRFLRVWSLDEEGRPVCAVDAFEVATTDQQIVEATLAENARIRNIVTGEATNLPVEEEDF